MRKLCSSSNTSAEVFASLSYSIRAVKEIHVGTDLRVCPLLSLEVIAV